MSNKIIIIKLLFLLLSLLVFHPLIASEKDYLKQSGIHVDSTLVKSAHSTKTDEMKHVVPEKGLFHEVSSLTESAKSKKLNPEKLERAIYEGEIRAVLCVYCHGKDGNSVRPYIPNLAAQTPAYLLTQFELFSRGERINNTMQELAKTLSFDDKVNIALFFSDMTIKPEKKEVNIALYREGKTIYATHCAHCHGTKAHGNHQMPYLADQKKYYLIRTLNLLRDGDKSRINSPMIPIAKNLTKDDILRLAEYLSSMSIMSK